MLHLYALPSHEVVGSKPTSAEEDTLGTGGSCKVENGANPPYNLSVKTSIEYLYNYP